MHIVNQSVKNINEILPHDLEMRSPTIQTGMYCLGYKDSCCYQSKPKQDITPKQVNFHPSHKLNDSDSGSFD